MHLTAVHADAPELHATNAGPVGLSAVHAVHANGLYGHQEKHFIYQYPVEPSAGTASSADGPCWRGEGGCSPGRQHPVSAPSTPDNPPAPEASPDNAACPGLSARPAEPQSAGSEASPALGLHQPRSYRAQAPGSAGRSAAGVLGPAIRPRQTRPRPDPVTGRGGGQPKTEPISGRHPYPAGYRAGGALEHLFVVCLDTAP